MIKKRDTCLYCEKQMESETAKKKFCSDKCKVYWHRENPKVVLKNFNKLSTGTTKDLTQLTPKSNYSINTTPKNLDQLKELCPKELTGFEKSKWISANRLKYGI